MFQPQTPTQSPQWQKGNQAWEEFTRRHPELGLRPGRWGFHNFLRSHREALLRADALRLARNRFWLGHVDRFCDAAFECATGREPKPVPAAPLEPPHTFTRSPQLNQFVALYQVRCGSLSADEYFRLHGNLPRENIEKLLDLIERLLDLGYAVNELLPALEWHPETIPAADLARLERVKQALLQVTHGHQ